MKIKKVLRWAESLDNSSEWYDKMNSCYTVKELDVLLSDKIKETGTLNLFALLTNSNCIVDAEYPLDLFE